MNTNDEERLFQLYTLVEMAYQKQFQNKVKNIEELYPVNWYSDKNYKEKITIIAEALKTETLIVDTTSYKNMIINSKKR
mgnify:CR=1 FL=1